jgi:hypothetical protein
VLVLIGVDVHGTEGTVQAKEPWIVEGERQSE